VGRPTVFFRRGWTALREWLNLANEWGEVICQANSLPQGLHVRVLPALSAAPTPTRMVGGGEAAGMGIGSSTDGGLCVGI